MKLPSMTTLLALGAIGFLALRSAPKTVTTTWRLVRQPYQGKVHIEPGDLITLQVQILSSEGLQTFYDLPVIAGNNRGECSVYKASKDCLFWTGKVAKTIYPAQLSHIQPPLPKAGDPIEFESDHVVFAEP